MRSGAVIGTARSFAGHPGGVGCLFFGSRCFARNDVGLRNTSNHVPPRNHKNCIAKDEYINHGVTRFFYWGVIAPAGAGWPFRVLWRPRRTGVFRRVVDDPGLLAAVGEHHGELPMPGLPSSSVRSTTRPCRPRGVSPLMMAGRKRGRFRFISKKTNGSTRASYIACGPLSGKISHCINAFETVGLRRERLLFHHHVCTRSCSCVRVCGKPNHALKSLWRHCRTLLA